MRDSPEYPWPVESIHIFKEQAKLPEQFSIFKVLQIGIEFVYKQRIVRWQCGDEFGIDGKIIFRPVAGSACTTISIKGFVIKKMLTQLDQSFVTWGGGMNIVDPPK